MGNLERLGSFGVDQAVGSRAGIGGVALIAGLREIGRDVIRVGRALEILQVAGDTRSATQRVIIVDVAIRALARRNGVESG